MAPERHALLIGVADSPDIRTHPDPKISGRYSMLLGCDADAELMHDLLVEGFGFSRDRERTRILKTKQGRRRPDGEGARADRGRHGDTAAETSSLERRKNR